ncbi:uncharacterized protein LOC120935755, partial [Rana temporaria]|uniref:uncharacterized protein LOC120935755 n=1 Tax=Rana temporaria TaxID=8407 RepID=UPI001AADB700
DVFDKVRAVALPPHRPYDCAIELQPGAVPPRGRVYPLSVAENEAMEEYVMEALSRGHIRKSSSPAGAGFFFVKKKGGELRPCIDYRGLNRITIKNAYPIPLISELFDRLKGATVFTKLDLRAAYNLVRIKAGDEWKTAFNTRTGHYESLVMPFGLCNAPAVFQEFINDVFRDLLQQCVVVYLDDILVYSESMEAHILDVKRVLQRLRENKLFGKLEKCEFHRSQVTFLGYNVLFCFEGEQSARPSGLYMLEGASCERIPPPIVGSRVKEIMEKKNVLFCFEGEQSARPSGLYMLEGASCERIPPPIVGSRVKEIMEKKAKKPFWSQKDFGLAGGSRTFLTIRSPWTVDYCSYSGIRFQKSLSQLMDFTFNNNRTTALLNLRSSASKKGSLHPAHVSAVRLDPCDTSAANQLDLVDPQTSAQSDGSAMDVQLVFEGPGAPP